MDRGATSAFLAELDKAVCRPVHLLEVDFGSETVRLTDAAVHLAWGGYSWLASQFLGFSPIEETSEAVVTRCTVSLSGVDQAVVALLLQETYFNRQGRIYKAFLAEDLQVIVDPTELIRGRLDKPMIETDPAAGTCTASVDIVSRFSPFETTSGRHTNDTDQQLWYPGDLGMQQVTQIQEPLAWGSQFNWKPSAPESR